MKPIIRTYSSDIRFWKKVDERGPSDCWNWKSSIDSGGYGTFWLNGSAGSTHRYAWTSKKGDIPYGLHVLHHCDNRKCCNPNHLFLGTNYDNQIDILHKNRPSNAKLTTEDVYKIKRILRSRSMTQVDLGHVFKVTQRTISHIATGSCWSHLNIEEEF